MILVRILLLLHRFQFFFYFLYFNLWNFSILSSSLSLSLFWKRTRINDCNFLFVFIDLALDKHADFFVLDIGFLWLFFLFSSYSVSRTHILRSSSDFCLKQNLRGLYGFVLFFFLLFSFSFLFFRWNPEKCREYSKLLLVPKLKRTRMYAKQRTWNTERFEISWKLLI